MNIVSLDILTGLTEQHLLTRADGFMLHQQVEQPFNALCKAAANEGIEIEIASAFRSYQRQAIIWHSKLSGLRKVHNLQGQQININELSDKAKLDAVLLYSALPGASRHHWGTELDIYDAAAIKPDYKLQLEPHEYQAGGPFFKLTQWLNQHAASYGFFLPYAHYNGGVAAEPWHLSYQPLSKPYMAAFSVDILRSCIQTHPITEQSLVLQHLDSIYNQYVINIC